MEVARDNAKELFLLTLPSLHCHLQKAWLPKGSERGRLKGPPLRVYSLAGLVQKVGWAKKIFRRSKMSKWGHEFPLILYQYQPISFMQRVQKPLSLSGQLYQLQLPDLSVVEQIENISLTNFKLFHHSID